MTLAMGADARRRLDAHLDAVERVLVDAGQSREHRRGVVDDLEAQIVEILSRRTSEPTAADVSDVVAALDPPSAYGSGPPGVADFATAALVSHTPSPVDVAPRAATTPQAKSI